MLAATIIYIIFVRLFTFKLYKMLELTVCCLLVKRFFIEFANPDILFNGSATALRNKAFATAAMLKSL
jgi:hypothetical protein